MKKEKIKTPNNWRILFTPNNTVRDKFYLVGNGNYTKFLNKLLEDYFLLKK